MAKKITSVAWSATGLPAGLSIDAGAGVISGTPTVEPGTYTATLTVKTNYGTDTKSITIVVAIPEDWKPVIAAGQVVNAVADEAMSDYTVTGQNVTKTS